MTVDKCAIPHMIPCCNFPIKRLLVYCNRVGSQISRNSYERYIDLYPEPALHPSTTEPRDASIPMVDIIQSYPLTRKLNGYAGKMLAAIRK